MRMKRSITEPVNEPISKKSKPTISTGRFKSVYDNEFSFCSNLYPYGKHSVAKSKHNLTGNASFVVDDIKFNTSEHYYQYQKFLHIDPVYAKLLLETDDAKEVKRLAGKGAYIDSQPIRGNTKAQLQRDFKTKATKFEGMKVDIMRKGLFEKFEQNPDLKAALLATGDVKLSEQGRMKRDFWAHTGQDKLGELLRSLRTFFAKEVK